MFLMFHGEITSKISNDYTLNKFYHMYVYLYLLQLNFHSNLVRTRIDRRNFYFFEIETTLSSQMYTNSR